VDLTIAYNAIFASRRLFDVLIFQGPYQGFARFRRPSEHKTPESNKSLDETPWYGQNMLQWLWTMATDTVTLYLVHPHRSKDALGDLIDDWQGMLVSEGFGVYQNWVPHRQTCWAHLIRTARGLSEQRAPELAACGAWALRACFASVAVGVNCGSPLAPNHRAQIVIV
jgi:hypothetical protein